MTMPDLEHEELRMLYTVSAGDIAFFKKQQWNVTNYAVALYVGFVVIAAQFLTKPPSGWKLVVLCALAAAVGVAGLGALALLQSSIEVRRNRLAAVRKRLSEAFLEAWNQPKKSDDLLLLHRAVIIVGAIMSIWIIGGWA